METGNLITGRQLSTGWPPADRAGCPLRPPVCSVARRGGREERRGGQWSFGTCHGIRLDGVDPDGQDHDHAVACGVTMEAQMIDLWSMARGGVG